MITTVTPEGPRFFCAPAKMTPYFFTSTGREAMSEDISATSGTAPVSGSAVHCVPSIVLLVQRWTYEASGENLISSRRGRRANFSGSVEAAILWGKPFFNLPMALRGHPPGWGTFKRFPGRGGF